MRLNPLSGLSDPFLARMGGAGGVIAMLLALALILGGCEAFSTGKAVALDKGAKAADAALELAVTTKCRLLTGGAMKRRYMVNAQTWALWTDECLGVGASAIELPEPE